MMNLLDMKFFWNQFNKFERDKTKLFTEYYKLLFVSCAVDQVLSLIHIPD